MAEKQNLFGKTLLQLQQIVQETQMKPYAAKQIADWLYKKNITHINQMTNIPQAKREQLAEQYQITLPPPEKQLTSQDGTKKYLFPMPGKGYIETVIIPDKERTTICISSQVGCKMNCQFCMTGKQGYTANLTTSEILNQIRSVPEYPKLTNIVFMGMGEPMDNLDNVIQAIEIITAPYAYAWSPKRITVSTIGITEKVIQYLDKTNTHLAISLHAPNPQIRQQLMPIEKAYPYQQLLQKLHNYDFTKQRRLSFEYILFDKINDTQAHAETLAKQLHTLPCRVNLIPFHEIPQTKLKPTPVEQMIHFREKLNAKGITATIRTSRGKDILAACGMLSTAQKQKNTHSPNK